MDREPLQTLHPVAPEFSFTVNPPFLASELGKSAGKVNPQKGDLLPDLRIEGRRHPTRFPRDVKLT